MGNLLRLTTLSAAVLCVLLIYPVAAAAQETEPSFLARALESASLFEQPSSAPDPYANARQ
jgi:hypothetical protein